MRPDSNMEAEMLDSRPALSEGWFNWKPIPSRVTEEDLFSLENTLGHSLPPSFKEFLRYKHFYDLHIGPVHFCAHPINSWWKEMTDMVFNGFPREYLIDRGLLPYAYYEDWGALCFDTTTKYPDGEYIISLWDQEIPFDTQPLYSNFTEFLEKVDETSESLD